MGKTYTLIWFLLLAFFPVVIMATLYSRVVHTLWFHRPQHQAFDNRQQVRLDQEEKCQTPSREDEEREHFFIPHGTMQFKVRTTL